MKDLTSLLGRFLKSLGKDTLAKETIVEAVQRTTNITLSAEEVSVKENVLTLDISSPAKKNEIKLKEQKILIEIQERTGQNINKVFYK
jgi:hypothetical protein